MSAGEPGRGCGCALSVLAALVLTVVVSLAWSEVSDSRQAGVNRREADQQIATMAASFAQQVDSQGQRSMATDADLWRDAQTAQRAKAGTVNGVMAVGVQVLRPVSRGTDLKVDIRVMTVYREPGLITYGGDEVDRCFRVELPGRSAGSGSATLTALPTCPGFTSIEVLTSPTPSAAP